MLADEKHRERNHKNDNDGPTQLINAYKPPNKESLDLPSRDYDQPNWGTSTQHTENGTEI